MAEKNKETESSLKSQVVQTEEKEKIESSMSVLKEETAKVLVITAGSFIYAAGMNIFLRPLYLYAGGMMGFAQLFQHLFEMAGVNFGHLDITGILYYLMNIPAMLLCYRKMRHRFIYKTIVAVTLITVFLTAVPIPAKPIMDEELANCVIAGIICGAGIGIILRMGACDGGMNLLGMLWISEKGSLSIGKISLISNMVLYAIMLLLFDIPTVIYSLIYSAVNSTACDRIHTQNITSQVLIITKLADTKPLQVEIMGRLERGLTEIHAQGAFTGDNVRIFVIFLSKYEVGRLRSIVREYDPQALIVENEGVSVDGHFKRKLT